MENVIQRCDTCQTCKPRCDRHPETRHYYLISKYPFASVAMDNVHLPTCEVRKGYTVDYCFVIVERTTGYVRAITAALNGLDAHKLVELPFEGCLFFTGIPSEFLLDNTKYYNNKFVTTLCNLAVISRHDTVIYDHKSDGRAEEALKSIVGALRVYWQETNSQWYWSSALSHARPPVFGTCGRGSLPTGCGWGGCWRWDLSLTPQRALLRAGFALFGGGPGGPGPGHLLPGCGPSGVGRSPTPDPPP